MENPMKEAVRALAQYLVKGTLTDAAALDGLRGFCMVGGEAESISALHQALLDSGADAAHADRWTDLLLAAEDKAKAFNDCIIGRTEWQLKEKGLKPPPELNEKQALAVFVTAAWGKAARADEGFKPEVVPATAPAPAAPLIDLSSVPVASAAGPAKKPRKAAEPPDPALMAASAVGGAAGPTATPPHGTPAATPAAATPAATAPTPAQRIAQLETEKAALEAKVVDLTERLLAATEGLLAAKEERANALARLSIVLHDRITLENYVKGVGERPSWLGPEPAPHAAATPAPMSHVRTVIRVR